MATRYESQLPARQGRRHDLSENVRLDEKCRRITGSGVFRGWTAAFYPTRLPCSGSQMLAKYVIPAGYAGAETFATEFAQEIGFPHSVLEFSANWMFPRLLPPTHRCYFARGHSSRCGIMPGSRLRRCRRAKPDEKPNTALAAGGSKTERPSAGRQRYTKGRYP